MRKPLICIVLIFILFCSTFSHISSKQIYPFTEENKESYSYFSYENMTILLKQLQENNSDIMDLYSIGKTYEKRDIWLVKISDNVTNDEDEPGVLLMGAHHGCEKASYEVLIHYILHLLGNYSKVDFDDDFDGFINEDNIDGLDNDLDGLIDEDPSESRVRTIINSSQIFIIPMVNPDGVNASTRKNCEPNFGSFGLRKKITSIGVDLNRNYGYKWYSWFIRPWYYLLDSQIRDSDTLYRGEKPFSENETKAVKRFVERRNISVSLSFHGYMKCIMYPWWNSMLPTRDEDLFISVGSNMSNICSMPLLGRNYFFGYRGTTGTSEDWLYAKHGILSFCVELDNPNWLNDTKPFFVQQIGVNLYICEKVKEINTNQKNLLEKRMI